MSLSMAARPRAPRAAFGQIVRNEARLAWTTSCAASTQEAGTGVVDRRRRMPCSR